MKMDLDFQYVGVGTAMASDFIIHISGNHQILLGLGHSMED
jgi:hypothetical protein